MVDIMIKFRQLVRELVSLSNIEITIALIISIFVTVVDLLESDSSFLENSIPELNIAILGFLSLGILRDRFLHRRLSAVLENISPYPRRDVEIRDDYQTLVQSIVKSAEENIWVVLRTASIISELDVDFEDALERGCRLKIVSCNASNQELLESIMLESDANRQQIESKFTLGLEAIRNLKGKYNKQIDHKTINYLPSSLMFVTDRNQLDGQAFIIPFSLKSSPRKAPSIRVNNKDHKLVFEHYTDELDKLWNLSNHNPNYSIPLPSESPKKEYDNS